MYVYIGVLVLSAILLSYKMYSDVKWSANDVNGSSLESDALDEDKLFNIFKSNIKMNGELEPYWNELLSDDEFDDADNPDDNKLALRMCDKRAAYRECFHACWRVRLLICPSLFDCYEELFREISLEQHCNISCSARFFIDPDPFATTPTTTEYVIG